MKKKTGSTASYMTYGEYLLKYPQGRINENAKKNELGYCIISNQDKNNICWISTKSFRLINAGLQAAHAIDMGDMQRVFAAVENLHEHTVDVASTNLKKYWDEQNKEEAKLQKLREKQEEKERKERAYIVQARDEFSDLMLNSTAAQWAAILRLVKTVKKDADTIWLMTNEWKEKQKAERTSKTKKRNGK